jgi:hypothetical protein
MTNDMPVYLPWDTINFKIELEHNFHLGDAWAVFRRRQQEGEAGRPFPLALDARRIEEGGRRDTQILSTVHFQITVLRSNSLPGEYDLETIRALPVDEERGGGTEGIDLGAPAGVSFRIADFPDNPVCRVTHTSLELGEQGTRYLNR